MAEKQSLVDVIIHVNTTADFKGAVTMFNELLGSQPAPIETLKKVQKEVRTEEVTATDQTKAEETKAEEAKAEPEVKSESADTTDTPDFTVNLTDIKKSMSDVIKAGKKNEAKDLLKEFEAARVSELREDQYREFLGKLQDLL